MTLPPSGYVYVAHLEVSIELSSKLSVKLPIGDIEPLLEDEELKDTELEEELLLLELDELEEERDELLEELD